jgi:hypothetical protein
MQLFIELLFLFVSRSNLSTLTESKVCVPMSFRYPRADLRARPNLHGHSVNRIISHHSHLSFLVTLGQGRRILAFRSVRPERPGLVHR